VFSGAFLFRKAKIQKAIKQERWEKMDYQMFKEQLAALLKRKAGDDFEVKVESVQKLNGIVCHQQKEGLDCTDDLRGASV
jgi:hypothetical protein